MQKLINLYYKKYKEIFLYLIFGVLTTIVNIISFWICNDVIHIDYKVGNVIAWVVAVLFAFITNKLLVFESRNKTKEENAKEAIKFFLARIFSLVIDMGIMIIMIDVLTVNSIIAKIISNIVVIIVNYVLSKFIIFKK